MSCKPRSKSFVVFGSFYFGVNNCKQAGAELGQAQVKLDDIVVIVIEVVVKAMVEVKVKLLFRVGGWWVGGRMKRN